MGDISPNFNRSEFACQCGCGADTVDTELLDILDELRNHFGKPVHITSGNRCERHNRKICGSPNSQHLTGRAADIVVSGVTAAEVYAYLADLYRDKYGIGKYQHWTHVDSRSERARW